LNVENKVNEEDEKCDRISRWDSQNFFCKFVRFFVTLGLKILIFFRLKVLLEADIIKG